MAYYTPSFVLLNEQRMLAAAAAIPSRRLRSGRLRRRLPLRLRRARRPSSPLPPPLSPGTPSPAPSSGRNSPAYSGPGDEPLFLPSPSPPPQQPLPPSPAAAAAVVPPPAAPAAAPGLSQAQFDRAQVADQPRLPWAWQAQGRTNQEYVPAVPGRWWSQDPQTLEGMGGSKRRDWGHIGRIMETELGEQLLGEERCSACRAAGQECWVYSAKGAQQVSRPGSTCARCRVAARSSGCSRSKRVRRTRSPPAPGPRSLAAYKPFGGPPPGAGGSGIAAS